MLPVWMAYIVCTYLQMSAPRIEVEGPPRGGEEAHRALLTNEALLFVSQMVHHFDRDVEEVSIYLLHISIM